jgi:sulfur carrier protein ThiS adenylyltransferase
MNLFEKSILKYFGKRRYEKIRRVKIGIAGTGGLGSNCAAMLVRCGFRKFVLCDFDYVEISNLNRQFYFADQVGMPKVKALAENLIRINSALELEVKKMKITTENALKLFSSCNAVVEAFDRADQKKNLTDAVIPSGKFYVSASGLAGWGNSDKIITRKLGKNLYFVGDFKSETSKTLPPCSPRVNIVAAKQADIILSWVLEK